MTDVGDDRTGQGKSDRVRHHLGAVLLVTAGYGLAVFVGLFGPWLATRRVGHALEGSVSQGRPDPLLVDAAFSIASLTSPVCFAVIVVLVDLFIIRVLAGEPLTTNRSGLAGWIVSASLLLTLTLLPVTAALSPIGWFSVLLAPEVAIVTAAASVVAVVVASACGVTFPLAVALDGRPFRPALLRAVEAVQTAPAATLRPVAPLAVGWLVGAVVMLVGTGVFVLGAGTLWIGVGFLILPIAFVLLAASALVFAVAHVRYRLLSIRTYRRRSSSPSP